MTDLRRAAEEYLAVRRAVGFKLDHVGLLLFEFVAFLQSQNATRVTCDLALRWATLPAGASPGWWKSRLCAARGFARYLSAFDPLTQIPPTDLLPRLNSGSNRATPYIYSDDEIAALMAAAGKARFPLTAATCQTLIGLLSVTGMRVGESLRLDSADLDDERGVLLVRHSKFDRSREVPLHESTLEAPSPLHSHTRSAFPGSAFAQPFRLLVRRTAQLPHHKLALRPAGAQSRIRAAFAPLPPAHTRPAPPLRLPHRPTVV